MTSSIDEMIDFVRANGMEGIVAKRNSSVYQPGKRTGLWVKRRINASQEFVIGGFIPSELGVDSLIIGFYRGEHLIYAGRVRAGFVPASRLTVSNASSTCALRIVLSSTCRKRRRGDGGRA